MELSLPSELGYEVVARDAVAAFARRLGLGSEKVEDLKTALCEACINAIEHGNLLNPDSRVRVICQIDQERLVIDVCDEGHKAFALKSEPLSIAEKLAGLGSLRGMGLMLISQLSDEAGFVAHSGAGNCFRFAFHRPSFSR